MLYSHIHIYYIYYITNAKYDFTVFVNCILLTYVFLLSLYTDRVQNDNV